MTSLTDTNPSSADAELEQDSVRDEAELQERLARVRETVKRIRSLPIVGPILTDDDLYDENGLPK